MDTNSWVLWLGIIAAVLHVIEEYAEGWVHWANEEIGPRFGVEFTDSNFFLVNAALIFFALAGAAIGWWAPAVSLAVPALFVINAVFFHMLPSARGDRITPGTLSAVFIYLPVAAWMFWAAAEDGVLDFGTFLLAFLLGAAFMAYPLGVLVLGRKIGWQPRESGSSSEASDPVEAGERIEEPVIEVEGEPVEPATEVLDHSTEEQN